MSEPAQPAADTQLSTIDVIVSVVVLFSLAVAQPLLDLLGRNAEFFIARAAPPIDIVLVALAIGIATPLAIAAVLVGISRLHPATGRMAHLAVIVLLATILILQILDRTPLSGSPGWVEIGVSLVAGGLIAAAVVRSTSLRLVLRYAAIAPLVIVGLFLTASPSSQLVFEARAIASPATVEVTDPAPVVMLVFDEFPVASLMDGDGRLQEDVYPNFARLARDGTWFPNATTVQQQTEQALPAILTGRDPGDRDAIPTAGSYPGNLFTLLADTYELDVHETVTELCPDYACENTVRPMESFGDRWSLLVDDLRIVGAHLFLPDDVADDLPPIDQSWSNFAAAANTEDWNIVGRFNEQAAADRRIPVAEFIAGIEPPGQEPELDFIHALIPHVPWSYLRSGQTYPTPSPAPGSVSPGWGDDEWLVDQAYQQHLVQVTYVDTVIGDVIRRLEETGQYDNALIIVLADHGISVRPDIPHRRVAYPETVGDIAAVPLFIKRPNDPGGVVDDYRAETIDVLPTIADVLGIDLPWATDGVSLFDSDRPERTESQITGDEGRITFGVDGAEARAIAHRKIDHFGVEGPYGLAPPGHHDLLGVLLDDLDVDPDGGLRASISDRTAYASVDLDGESLPARVRGVLPDGTGSDADVIIAVAVNGEIAAVTRTEHTDEGTVQYGAMIPPSSLIEGSNEIELILVRGEGGSRTLHEITR